MATLATTIKEIISVPTEEQFKFVVRLADKVPAMVQAEDKTYAVGESDVVWLTRKELLNAVPVRMRPLVNNDVLTYILPELKIEVEPKEIHLGDMLGNKPAEHETIVHEVVNLETAPIALIKEAKEMLG